MGSFSWKTAVNAQYEPAGIAEGTAVKILIPAEYGGGYVAACYDDYGNFFTVNPYALGDKRCVPNGLLPGEKWYHSIDMYEWLFAWNHDHLDNKQSNMTYHAPEGFHERFPVASEHTVSNRSHGITIGCFDEDINKLKFPLKFVRLEDTSTYEQVGASYSDPDQGWGKGWAYSRALARLIKNDAQSTNPHVVLENVEPGELVEGRFANNWYN